MSGKPYPKASQLARGERRYRRKVASPKQWQAIIADKGRSCRMLRPSSLCSGAIEYHHVVPRDLGGDDLSHNIVPLCHRHHLEVTSLWPTSLQALAIRLTDAEYAYVVGKVGEDGYARLFGVSCGA